MADIDRLALVIPHSNPQRHLQPMRILITGITGFVGGHLVEALAQPGTRLFGVVAARRGPRSWRISTARPSCTPAELTDAARVEEVVRPPRPDWVIHLAGIRQPRALVPRTGPVLDDNLDATRVPVRRPCPDRVSAANSLRVHWPRIRRLGFSRPRMRRAETLKPASPYAASKAAGDLLSYQCSRSPGLDIVRVRLFNQIGPRQSADYAVANFARQIAAIEAGKQEPVIETGDLSASRDIADVRRHGGRVPLLMETG